MAPPRRRQFGKLTAGATAGLLMSRGAVHVLPRPQAFPLPAGFSGDPVAVRPATATNTPNVDPGEVWQHINPQLYGQILATPPLTGEPAGQSGFRFNRVGIRSRRS